MIKVIVIIIAILLGLIVFFGVIYVASGIQAKAWLDVFDKYFSEKFKK